MLPIQLKSISEGGRAVIGHVGPATRDLGGDYTNLSAPLRLMGNIEEADQHLKEAEDFMPPTAEHR